MSTSRPQQQTLPIPTLIKQEQQEDESESAEEQARLGHKRKRIKRETGQHSPTVEDARPL